MTTGAIYCRISQDTEGLALGVARQEADCRELAERNGLDSVVVFTDNDRGASTKSRKPRPQYADMMSRADAGEFAAILAYSTSRLTRRPMEFDKLITLAESRRVQILTVVSGRVDLSTADGRAVARTLSAWDAAEAERTAERVARKHLENAQRGKAVGGVRPFGYEHDKVTICAPEAALIRKAATDVIAGVSLREVARQWQAAGVESPRARPWRSQTIRQMLKGPRLAGWRVHQGEIAVGPDGKPVRGEWSAILDQGTHDAVLAALTTVDTRTRKPRKGARHYLLTGIVRCGVCNAPMYGNRYAEGRHYYVCSGASTAARDHSNSVSGHGTDDFVSAALLELLAGRELPVSAAGEFTQGERLSEVESNISDLMGAYTAGTLTAAVVFPAVGKLEGERDSLEAERRAAHAVQVARPELSHIDAETWAAMDTARRRVALETFISAVLIRPATVRGNRLDLSRIDVVWKR